MPSNLDPNAQRSRLRRRPVVVLRFPTIEPITVFCGAKIPFSPRDICEAVDGEYRSWSVQMLPEEPPPPLRIPTHSQEAERSNGCGAEVHGCVCLTRREGEQCWYGWTEGVKSNVVPLETRYFPDTVAEALGLTNGLTDREDCRCTVGGVGCAVCGNPLGTLQTLCADHAPSTARRDLHLHLFLASAVSPAPQTATRSAWWADTSSTEIFWIEETSPRSTPVSPLGSVLPFIPPAVHPVAQHNSHPRGTSTPIPQRTHDTAIPQNLFMGPQTAGVSLEEHEIEGDLARVDDAAQREVSADTAGRGAGAPDSGNPRRRMFFDR